jgi:predicted amidohydrolase
MVSGAGEKAVAVIQSLARPGDVPGSVARHVELAHRAAREGARLAVFPELSLTGYDRGLTRSDAIAPDDARLNSLQRVADQQGLLIIAGAPLDSPGGLLIGALCFVPHRGVVTYSKRFLHEGEEVAFVAGPGGESLMLDGETVCVAICAEIAHPEHAREAAANGAGIYAASCFITPGGYAHDAGLLAGYAQEHRMAVLMANYGAPTSQWQSAGGSAIWSSDGSLLAKGPSEGEAVVIARLPARAAR